MIELFLRNFTFNDKFKGCLFNNCMGKGELMNDDAFEIPKNYFEKEKFTDLKKYKNRLRKFLDKQKHNGNIMLHHATQKRFAQNNYGTMYTVMASTHLLPCPIYQKHSPKH